MLLIFIKKCWAERVYDLCVYYMTGTPEGSTKSGFMEKPGIEPATLGFDFHLIVLNIKMSEPV